MRRLEGKEREGIMQVLSCVGTAVEGDLCVAVAETETAGGNRHHIVCESYNGFGHAAEMLWREMCDRDEMGAVGGAVYFLSEDAEFVSCGIDPVMHYVFDHGRVSFMDVMWRELADDIMDAYGDKPCICDTEWTVGEAVDEMVALWQTGPCGRQPWEICGDWSFISDELHDVMVSPRFGGA